MIPYLPKQRPRPKTKQGDTLVAILDGAGKMLQPVGQEPVEAAAILIRIAYRFQIIARARLAGSELALPQGVRERCAAL